MAKNKRLKLIKRTFLILVVLGLATLHFFVPRLITEIRNPVVGLIKRNRTIPIQLDANENSSIKRKLLSIPSFDDITLAARLTYASTKQTKGTVILLHGIRSNKDTFIDLSSFLSENGYNSVALDSRAHGESGGQFCSFGVNEKKDIQKVVDYLIEKENLDHIGVWGQSLGGALGLQAMGIDQRIEYGIIESTFSDFKTIVNDYFHLNAGFSFAPFSNYLANRAGEIAEFDSNDARPIRYCENITQPILMVHGTKDNRIDIKYGRANYSKIKSIDKEFMAMEGATHTNVWKTGGDAYFKKALLFLDRQTMANIVSD